MKLSSEYQFQVPKNVSKVCKKLEQAFQKVEDKLLQDIFYWLYQSFSASKL